MKRVELWSRKGDRMVLFVVGVIVLPVLIGLCMRPPPGAPVWFPAANATVGLGLATALWGAFHLFGFHKRRAPAELVLGIVFVLLWLALFAGGIALLYRNEFWMQEKRQETIPATVQASLLPVPHLAAKEPST
jgi:hypothetical protein